MLDMLSSNHRSSYGCRSLPTILFSEARSIQGRSPRRSATLREPRLQGLVPAHPSWASRSSCTAIIAACPDRSTRLLPVNGYQIRGRLYGTSVRMGAQHAAEARKEADKLACEAWTNRMLFRGRRSPHLPSATRSMRATSILRSGALAATRTRPSRSTSCAGQRQRQFTNWSATCAARPRSDGGKWA
jgi:hypothetical protein